MVRMQQQVHEFHEAAQEVGAYAEIKDSPQIPETAELRAELIEEEAAETAEALRNGDLVGVIDGLCDLLYVAFGTAVAAGIDIEEFYDHVHETNMAKCIPGKAVIKPGGKLGKPADWEPPSISRMLEDYYGR